MARRADPQRIFEARRSAVLYSLMDTGMDEATADRCCSAWIIEATRRRLPRDAEYWRRGAEWIAAERPSRRTGLA
jgi:hypothetical protein